MKRLKKILSIAFLLLFVTNLLHDVVPHVHHEHDIIAGKELHQTDHNHTSTGHQHFPDKNDAENERDIGSFFDFLFVKHAHVKHVFQEVPGSFKHLKPLKHFNSKFVEGSSNQIDYRPKSLAILRANIFSIPERPYFLANHLRGPPTLG